MQYFEPLIGQLLLQIFSLRLEILVVNEVVLLTFPPFLPLLGVIRVRRDLADTEEHRMQIEFLLAVYFFYILYLVILAEKRIGNPVFAAYFVVNRPKSEKSVEVLRVFVTLGRLQSGLVLDLLLISREHMFLKV